MRNLKVFFGYLVLIICAFTMLYPFFAMVNLSFAHNADFFNNPGKLFYLNLTLDNYKNLLNDIPVFRYFLNSLFVASVATLGQVVFCTLAGYAFAKMNFKFRDILFLIILITMMVPPQVNIIPLFFMMRELHLINTYWALILPAMFGGFGIFMMRQYFLTFPKELEDASKIDGCNYFQTFFKIVMPLAVPMLITLGIFTFVSTWNSFMWPLIVTNTENLRTLPVGLAIYKGSFRELTQWGELLACATICTIPVMALFIAGKKYFINDILLGGVKE
ncbi:carbohydrate ABC transporter permease [bacterium]|nr:carbohydrate ABC transporter permease [bacterium]